MSIIGKETPALDAVLGDIEKLKEARNILSEIYVELGPYMAGLSTRTLMKLQNYFDFDDSE